MISYRQIGSSGSRRSVSPGNRDRGCDCHQYPAAQKAAAAAGERDRRRSAAGRADAAVAGTAQKMCRTVTVMWSAIMMEPFTEECCSRCRVLSGGVALASLKGGAFAERGAGPLSVSPAGRGSVRMPRPHEGPALLWCVMELPAWRKSQDAFFIFPKRSMPK